MCPRIPLAPSVIFLVLASVFGLAFLVLTPPFQVPDEQVHFYRAFHVSEFKVTGRVQGGSLAGDLLPKSVGDTAWGLLEGIPFHPEKKQDVKKIFSAFGRPLKPEDRIFTDFRGALLYSPVAYLPQAAGILAVRAFGGPPILMLYAGRLFNLAVWIGLIFLALRITPVFPWIFIAVALMPQSLFQAASQSADAATQALSFLLIAQILRLAFGAGNRRAIALLGVTTVFLALAKPGYFLVVILFLIVPAAKTGGRQKWAAAFAALIGLGLAVTIGWTMIAQGSYLSNHPDPNIKPAAQIQGMIRSPLSFPAAAVRTTIEQAEFFLRGIFGTLGWGDTPLPGFLPWIFYPLMLGIAFFGGGGGRSRPSDSSRAADPAAEFVNEPAGSETDVRIRPAHRLVFFGVALLMYVFVAATAYVLWTPVGAKTFFGVQGRYFIPFIPVLFFAFALKKPNVGRAWVPSACAIFAVCSLVISLRTVFLRYYG